ncbi:disease resistance protein RPP2A-like [Humulus lupulus]|uniref:disease resistance protein RPP2A-like n=1 Tax=Humulus lupulus TaxID=3486 RepID=UPI002B409BD1|nr:disease resistance protein RPP2A-like [Humulus lupulus]
MNLSGNLKALNISSMKSHSIVSYAFLRSSLIIQLGELLEERHQDIVNMFAKERLSRKKLLIVLDDLFDVEQFEYLVGDRNWLRHGSRVIITTRNKQMLNNIGVDWIYMAEQLDDGEALQLFSLKAFQRDSPPKKYMELSKEVVNYAVGMPLALKVLGYIENDFDDGLDDHERDAFLDIACFFKGNRITFVEEILGGCGFKDTIRNLINNSLISITQENKLWMHNLVQQMGWEIVRQQNPKEPGKHSRLWITNEVCRVLLHDLGTSSIEGLSLNTFHMKYDIDIKPTAFNEMYNLRLLRIIVCMGNYKLSVSGGLDFLPDALRYLEWAQYPLKSLPSSFIPHNLVNLDMPLGQFEHLWNGLQHVESLQYVSLCFSKKLSNIPNLSRANLKCADFEGCTSLVEVPSLRFQQINEKNSTKIIRNQITSNVWSKREDLLRYGPLQGLKVHDYSLNLNECSNFKTLSHLSGGIEYIYLRSTAIEELHHSIWSLGHLALLDLNNCKSLKNLPEDICNLECMKELNLGGCVCINMFPKLPKNIVRVDLSGSAIEQVPSSSFDYCTSLEVLCLKDCTRLEYVSTTISKLKLLNYLDLSYCSKLKCFPNITEPMEHLVHLYLDGSGIEEIQYRSIKTLIGLRMLNLRQCKNLKSLPIGNFCTSHLEVLYLPERLELESSTFQRFEYEYYRDAYNTAKNSILNQETAYSEEGSILFGDKIPFWFTQQSEGSSIGFKFSSNLLEIDSITLALCVCVS